MFKFRSKNKSLRSKNLHADMPMPENERAQQPEMNLHSNKQPLYYHNIDLPEKVASFNINEENYHDIFNHQSAGFYRIRVFANASWDIENWKANINAPCAIEFASDKFYEIINWGDKNVDPNSDFLSKTLSDNDLATFLIANEKANQKLVPFNWEGEIKRDNNTKWIRFESTPRKLDNGDVHWTGILYDITEWKVTTEELKRSRLHLEDVLVGANVGTLEWNVQTGKVRFNEIWAKNLGYSYTEVKIGLVFLGANGWKYLTHRDDIPYANEMLERHFSGELPYHQIEVRMRHKNGKWLWIRQEGKVKTWTADGKPELMYGTHTDITARKEAELALSRMNEELEMRVAKRTAELQKLNAELKIAEQKFRTVSDFSYTWEYWRGRKGEIIFMSPSVEQITGYTVAEFENDPDLLNKIVYKADKHIWDKHLSQRVTCDLDVTSLEILFRIVTKNGDIRWIGHLCRSIQVEGKNLGIRVSNRDTTETVLANNALLDLTVKVEERERNRFSRELHDGLGPLLSTVKLYFDWLADTDDIEKRKMIIEKGGFCIETAIETTRELSFGMSSQLLINEGFNRAMTQFAQRINDTSKILIAYETNTNMRFDNFIETTLYRIATELIKNTLNYGKATHARIIFYYDEQFNKINLNYSDNGIGFDIAHARENSKGLGMMNIYQRVKVLRGEIELQSQHGLGMKADITIPVD